MYVTRTEVSLLGFLQGWIRSIMCFAELRVLSSVYGLGFGEGAVGNDCWYRKTENNVIIRLALSKAMLW